MIYVRQLILFIFVLGVENIVFVDECGIDASYQRNFARAKIGVRIHDTRCGKKYKRTNAIAALWGKKHVAIQCYEHATNALFFEDWFEFELLAVMPKHTLIIMDNATFHRKKQLFNIAQRYGMYLLFLPPYSPDFNPIEQSWANLKHWLCDNIKRFSNFDWLLQAYFDY